MGIAGIRRLLGFYVVRLLVMEPLVSVIVPVYNVEAYLPHCLRAISEQTYRNLEIILVDDGSTDGSGDLCDDFASKDPRGRVIHQRNAGLWAARNAGHDAANGDVLFFPDADDYFNRDMIRLLIEAINRGGGYDLAMCRIKKTEGYDEDVSVPSGVNCREMDRDELFFNLFHEEAEDSVAVFMWNKLFRRRLIEGLRSNDYARSQDKDYMIRLFPRVEKAALIENGLYYWVQRPDSMTHSRKSWRIFHECRARMCYRDYMEMPDAARKYAHYLLEELYTRMLFWRDESRETGRGDDVSSECRRIVKDTRSAFWRCREIPLWKRIACMVLAHHPGLTRIFIRCSGNR